MASSRSHGLDSFLNSFESPDSLVQGMLEVCILLGQVMFNALDLALEPGDHTFNGLESKHEVTAKARPKQDISNDLLARKVAIDQTVRMGPIWPAD